MLLRAEWGARVGEVKGKIGNWELCGNRKSCGVREALDRDGGIDTVHEDLQYIDKLERKYHVVLVEMIRADSRLKVYNYHVNNITVANQGVRGIAPFGLDKNLE